MDIKFDLISVLIFIGCAQAILLSAALIFKRRNKGIANYILALFLLVLASLQVLAFLYHSAKINFFPYLIRTETPLLFLVGPILLLYLQAVTNRGFSFTRKYLLHLLPFAVCVLYLTPFYLGANIDKIEAVFMMQSKKPAMWHAEVSTAMLHLLGYMAVVASKLRQHRKLVKNTFSSIARINLSWLQNLLIAIGIIWLALTFHYNYPLPLCNVIFSTLITVVVIYVGFKGLTQPEIFMITNGSTNSEKYATSALTSAAAENGLIKLQRFLAAEKPFLKSDFSLPGLAKSLTMSPHHLSQIINGRLNQNFFEFANQYRIEEAKKRLKDPNAANITVAEVATEVGFNSISAFNTAFRRFTGTTPSRYRKNAQR